MVNANSSVWKIKIHFAILNEMVKQAGWKGVRFFYRCCMAYMVCKGWFEMANVFTQCLILFLVSNRKWCYCLTRFRPNFCAQTIIRHLLILQSYRVTQSLMIIAFHHVCSIIDLLWWARVRPRKRFMAFHVCSGWVRHKPRACRSFYIYIYITQPECLRRLGISRFMCTHTRRFEP